MLTKRDIVKIRKMIREEIKAMNLVTKEELQNEMQKIEQRLMKQIALIQAKVVLLEKKVDEQDKVYTELEKEVAELRGDMTVVIATYKRKQLLHSKN